MKTETANRNLQEMKKGRKIRMERRGPSIGYDSAEKASYRERVWMALIKNGVDGDGYYICLPSKEGLEIDVMTDIGIRPDRIIAIDESAALLAMAKWRKKYPEVRCYGSKLSRASERIAKDGLKIAAANLDLCNNISAEMIEELSAFYANLDCERTAITFVKGRESTVLNLLVKKCCDSHGVDARVGALLGLIEGIGSDRFYSVNVEASQSYLHHKTPMVWVVIETLRAGEVFAITDEIESKAKEIEALAAERARLFDRAATITDRDHYKPETLVALDDEYVACNRLIVDNLEALSEMCSKQSEACRLKVKEPYYRVLEWLGIDDPYPIVQCGRKRLITMA